MKRNLARLLAAIGPALFVIPAMAEDNLISERASQGGQAELPAYIHCVPYARQQTGIAIYGDALTWWEQAEGRFARGSRPSVGAVMAFRPHGNMRLGHVAAVSRVIDDRTVLLSHANWSPIEGRRGRVEEDVQAIDVSSGNDWSEVRVWYHPLEGLGTTVWPIHGFIYPDEASAHPVPPATKAANRQVNTDRSLAALHARPRRDVIGTIIRREY